KRYNSKGLCHHLCCKMQASTASILECPRARHRRTSGKMVLLVLKRKISVVVPTFNRLAMLREALASIRDVEGSGVGAEFEIVVGDNGLKEGTRRLCLEY